MDLLSKHELQTAYMRVKRFAEETPLLSFPQLNAYFDANIWLKCEQFQPIAAFKIRGASNFALQLPANKLNKGLVTHSSGNHAQALAYVAHHLGVKAFIVMPKDSNKVKIKNAERWGAEIRFCEPNVEARHSMAAEVQQETGATMIPPYDHEWIVAGQASCAMEIFREKTNLDLLVAPLGGGGLLSGSALAASYFSPSTKVIGAEPEQASDGHDGFRSGKRIEKVNANTVADGLRTTVGEIPFPLIQKHVDDVWLAEESAIVEWMYRIWEMTKQIIEPSCAVPFAAMDGMKDQIKGKDIAVIITGGNVDFSELPIRP